MHFHCSNLVSATRICKQISEIPKKIFSGGPYFWCHWMLQLTKQTLNAGIWRMHRPIGTTFISGEILKLLKYTLNSDYHANSQSKEAYFEPFSSSAICGWLWVLALPLDAAFDKADIERRYMTNAPANWHNISTMGASPTRFVRLI